MSDRKQYQQRVSELLADHDGPLPVWIRPPKKDVEFYTGLSRSKLYELAAKGLIVSRTLREPGQIKGTRLFLLKSILAFIEGCPSILTRAPLLLILCFLLAWL